MVAGRIKAEFTLSTTSSFKPGSNLNGGRVLKKRILDGASLLFVAFKYSFHSNGREGGMNVSGSAMLCENVELLMMLKLLIELSHLMIVAWMQVWRVDV